jgi:acyl carrier protein
MNQNTNDLNLQQAFQLGLGLDPTATYETLEFAKTEQWDSIAHMKLIAAIEEKFAIRLDVKDILELNSYLKAREIVNHYLKKNS